MNVLGDEDDGRNADERVQATGRAGARRRRHACSVGSVRIGPRRTMRPRCRCRAFARRADERVIAGVCAGIAQALAVDVTLVRLVFALLALAGGAGIVLYLALWAYSGSRRPVVDGAARRRSPGCCSCTRSASRTARSRRIVLIAGGLALAWRRGGFRARRPALLRSAWRSSPAARCSCSRAAARGASLLAPGAIAARCS